MNTALLDLQSVTTAVPVEGVMTPVVQEVNLTVGRGEAVALVGESGSGKSMTARTIIRLLPSGAHVSGHVYLDGLDLLQLPDRQLRQVRARGMSMIFQDPRSGMNPLWTCGNSITEVLRVNSGLDGVGARARARQLLADVGITDVDRVLRAYPGELSGGMLQRVLIAASLAAEPDLLIADEPTTALDVTIQAEIVTIFDELRMTRQLALLFITHDLDLAATLCHRIHVMYAGRVVEHQPTDALFAGPRHPYTSGLLGARPPLHRRPGRLNAIPGRPPAVTAKVPGCAFHPRCRFAVDRCRAEAPPLLPINESAGVAACWRSDEIEAELRDAARIAHA